MPHSRHFLLLALFVAISFTSARGSDPQTVAGDMLLKAFESQGYVGLELQRLKSGYLSTTVGIGEYQLHMMIEASQAATSLDRIRTQGIGLLWEADGDPARAAVRAADSCLIASMRLTPSTSIRVRACPEDLSDINKHLGEFGDPHLDGVIGGDLLRSRAAIIDFSRLRLYIQPTGAVPSLAKGDVVRNRLALKGYDCIDLARDHQGFLTRAVKVDSIDLTLRLYTGSPSTWLDVIGTKAKGIRWKSDVDPAVQRGEEYDSCRIESLKINSFATSSIHAWPYYWSGDTTSAKKPGQASFDGMLGNDLLVAHGALIDVARQRLFLRPLAED
ncbi:MAG: hypothetical protein K8U03_07865 [Planctomycetia bacterium]|nr:hypothetical protein [Planctomycetia bacterium]